MKTLNLLIRSFYGALLLFYSAHSLVAQSTDSSTPNIIIITTDQQSADAMSFRMGRKWLHTPYMDRLAAEGVYFTRAYAANPLCVPSRNSMITGLYPHTTGIQANDDLANWGGEKNPQFWTGKDYKSMGTYFKEAGYQTAFFGKWHINYDPNAKTAHGFDAVYNFRKPIIDDTIPGAVDDYLQQPHKKPLLIWASFINPHDICQWSRFQKLPEGPIAKLPQVDEWPPLPDNLAPPQNETEAMTLMRKSYHLNAKTFPVGDYSQFDWRRLAWGYYRLMEKVDTQIGKLLAVLDKNGLAENTLILFTSDHGECLGAHLFNQKTVFYEESARVPFIIHYPAKVNPGLNNTLVNTGTDVLPTLLDFAGIEKPDGLPGVSWKNTAIKNEDLHPRDYIVVQNNMNQGGSVNGKVVDVNGRMVRGERYKYCLYDTLNHREALFDIEKDPGETINIAEMESSGDILEKYRDYLNEFITTYHDVPGKKMLQDIHSD